MDRDSHYSFLIAASCNSSAVGEHFGALAETLRLRGHTVVFISPSRPIQSPGLEGEGRYDYHWPSHRPVTRRDAAFLMPILSSHRPDCTIGNFGAVNLLAFLTWLRRVPVRIAWYHTLSTQIDLDSDLPSWRRKLQRLRKSLIYSTATHLLTNSSCAASDAQLKFGIPPSKCIVQWLSLADPLKGKNPAGPRAGRLRVVCAGRFSPSKGQITLVRALAKLSQDTDWEVLFVGDGPCREHCRKVACELGLEQRTEFVGRLRHDEVLEVMAGATVTVVPSQAEAFGYVGIESLALGVPVVASAVGGLSEVIRHGYDGLLIPPNDPDGLAAGLAKIIGNPELAAKMGANARAGFLDRFERSRLVPQHASWLENLLDTMTA